MLLPGVLACVLLCAATALAQSPLATVTVAATARVEARVSLSVSAEVLRFIVHDEAAGATAAVDFVAGTRAMPGRDVVLIAELAGQLEPPSGGPIGGAMLGFAGEGDGTLAGDLQPGAPRIVARWIGGGQRRGRLVFTLRSVAPGAYTVPVRLSVSVP
jgi:hypothetical protein